MDKYLFVGAGGFLGAVLRYWLSSTVQQLSNSALVPVGTLVVNVLGCLVIGFLSELAEEHGLFTAEARAFVFIGILGGFTTFSTFGNETMNLLRDGQNNAVTDSDTALDVGVDDLECLVAVNAHAILHERAHEAS